jgi:hypothetical protein
MAYRSIRTHKWQQIYSPKEVSQLTGWIVLLILRPKLLKFLALVFLLALGGSCVLFFLNWLTRTLGI